MKRINVVSVEMKKEKGLMIDIESKSITSPDEANHIIRTFLGNVDREHFIILMLDTKNKVNAIHTVSIGSLNSSIVHPREVFKASILANANKIILAHNHPSGNPQPSREDKHITSRLIEGGKILGIEVVDHIIIGDEEFLSFKEQGLI